MSSPFEWLSEALEERTNLKRIEARGTIRLALKATGFDPKQVTQHELGVVIRKVLPRELESRRIEHGEALCEGLARDLAAQTFESGAARTDTAMSIFGRLGRTGR